MELQKTNSAHPGRVLFLLSLVALFLYFIVSGFSLFLSSTSLHAFIESSMRSTIEHSTGKFVFNIERGLRFGKELDVYDRLQSQLYNFAENVRKSAGAVPLKNIYIFDISWQYITSAYPDTKQVQPSPESLLEKHEGDAQWREVEETFYYICPLRALSSEKGFLVVELSREEVENKIWAYLFQNILVIVIGGAPLVLLQSGWLAYSAAVKKHNANHTNNLRYTLFFFVSTAVLFVSISQTFSYANVLRTTLEQNAITSASLLAQDLEKLEAKQVHIQQIPTLHKTLQDLVESAKEIFGVQLYIDATLVNEFFDTSRSDSTTVVEIPINRYWKDRFTSVSQIASLRIWLDNTLYLKDMKVWIVDQLTIFITACILLFQCGNLFITLAARPFRIPQEITQRQDIYLQNQLVVSLVFFFFLANDADVSFLPIFAGTLTNTIPLLSDSLVPAFTISVTSLFAAAGMLLTGFLHSRTGWKPLIPLGMLSTIAGLMLASIAASTALFFLSRAFTGLGFGSFMLAVQLSAVTDEKNQNNKVSLLAQIYAASYAGTICASALGGILYPLLGGHLVFFISAVGLCIPLLLFFFLSRMQPADSTVSPVQAAPHTQTKPLGRVPELLLSPPFIALMLFVFIPMSMLAIGFMDLIVPLELEKMGVSQGNIGRIFMLYSICFVVFATPIAIFIEKMPALEYSLSLLLALLLPAALVLYFSTGYIAYCVTVFFISISHAIFSSCTLLFVLTMPAARKSDTALVSSAYQVTERIFFITAPVLFNALFFYLNQTLFLIFIVWISIAALFYFFTARKNSAKKNSA